VGDYTTVIWILGKGLGGTFEVTDESGQPVRLKIAGILGDSIFQGSLFVSEQAMRRLYPTQSVYDLFLFKLRHDGGTGAGDVESTAAGLESSLVSYGFRARPVRDIAAELIQVDMGYVSMLQAMLASGVLVGTLGFAAKVARETIERRYELGVMRALGFRRGQVAGLLLGENLFLFLLGFGLALAAALVSAFTFLKTLPGALDTLLLLGLLVAVIALSTLYPVRRFNSSSVASVLRI